MVTQITKRQANLLELEMKQKKEDDDYVMTIGDNILDLFLPVKVGLQKNGLTANDVAEAVGAKSFKELTKIRTSVCQLASELIKIGVPFGGVKYDGLKRYGFPTAREFDQIQMDRKKLIVEQIESGSKYLDDADPLKKICKTITKEYNKQLQLFYDGE